MRARQKPPQRSKPRKIVTLPPEKTQNGLKARKTTARSENMLFNLPDKSIANTFIRARQAAADRAAEAARKKAEKDALLKAEEASLPTKAKSGNAKAAQKKTRGTLDLSQLDDTPSSSSAAAALNASGIDNALDALSLTGANNDTIDRHPERRFKAAYTQFETRRLEEMKDEKGLRRQQKIDQIRKEFEKHPDNPFNQVSGRFNSTREELKEIGEAERKKVEERLASP